MQIWLKRLGVAVAIIAAIAGLIALIVYVGEARLRQARLSTCEWTDVPNAEPSTRPYIATWCLLAKDTAIIRVYDLSRSQLLAERTYRELDRPLVVWMPNELGYLTGAGDESIALPPTLLDRIRVKFP